jgi:hypothetical protein
VAAFEFDTVLDYIEVVIGGIPRLVYIYLVADFLGPSYSKRLNPGTCCVPLATIVSSSPGKRV